MRETVSVLTTIVVKQFGEPPQFLKPVKAGGNNRLIRFKAHDQDFIAKFYYDDGRARLKREFTAITFFSARGLPVPRAVLADPSYNLAVYSFEAGYLKQGSDVTRADIKQIADFLLSLHAIPNGEVPESFQMADGAFCSYQDYISLIDGRMSIFVAALNENRMHPKAADFAREYSVPKLVEDLVEDAVVGLTHQEIKQRLGKRSLRLSPVDMGPHNTLFTPTTACFIDFEYTGWDDPMRTLAEFTQHQANRGIVPEVRRHFPEYYLRNTNLPDSITVRLTVDMKLMAVIWLTTQLLRLTPERIEALTFAHPNFDMEYHIDSTIAKARARINDFSANEFR